MHVLEDSRWLGITIHYLSCLRPEFCCLFGSYVQKCLEYNQLQFRDSTCCNRINRFWQNLSSWLDRMEGWDQLSKQGISSQAVFWILHALNLQNQKSGQICSALWKSLVFDYCEEWIIEKQDQNLCTSGKHFTLSFLQVSHSSQLPILKSLQLWTQILSLHTSALEWVHFSFFTYHSNFSI